MASISASTAATALGGGMAYSFSAHTIAKFKHLHMAVGDITLTAFAGMPTPIPAASTTMPTLFG